LGGGLVRYNPPTYRKQYKKRKNVDILSCQGWYLNTNAQGSNDRTQYLFVTVNSTANTTEVLISP